MAVDDDWESLLDGHPIFSQSNTVTSDDPLELSLSSLQNFTNDEESDDGSAPSGRRRVMCMKDADLIVACRSEVRMTSLGDAKVSGGSQRTYKVLHTPNIQFNIHQICLSPNKKLLAVAGAFQVTVIVLPRSGFSKMVTSRIDCKSLQIGQHYHTSSMSPVAKIDWHPWGEAGSTLLVMTVDGKLREYDVSSDPDGPRKTLDFISEKKRGAYAAVDESEREVASFTFGKGKADWGPLTIYALMRSGDIYAICPYLPENSSIPSSYLHALECFVSAKEEFVSENNEVVDESFSTLYDYQRKFVNGLLKQLPDGVPFPSSSRSISIHAPKSFGGKAARQGPFLLQPSPPELEGSPSGDATDIVYLTLGSAFMDDEADSEVSSLASERLGVLLIAFQDGRVDVCLDLEKVEARWDSKQPSPGGLPMLAVYEVIDLGFISTLAPGSGYPDATTLDLLQGNHPVFHPDPIHDDTVYAYHAFGVHVLNLNPIFQNLAAAMKEEDEQTLKETVQSSTHTTVQAILSTYSVERKSSDPVTSVVIPNDVYLTYSIFILTSTMRVVTFALNLRTESLDPPEPSEKQHDTSALPALLPASGPPAYVSLLTTQSFALPAALSRPMGFPTIAKLSLPKSHSIKDELRLTPETLRYLGTVAERISGEVHDAVIACHALKSRADFQKQEYERLQKKFTEIVVRAQNVAGPRKREIQERAKKLQDEQARMLGRMDRVLQALIKKASPELNEHETRWFEELQRMKAQVQGVGRYDQDSLKSRIRQLQNEFERLLPSLKDLAKKEAERKAQLEESNSGAGVSYVKAYERLSKEESTKLENAMKQIVKLAGKLEISGLSSPPS
ncbi:hypothetical protein DFH11DRAFT_1568326 [Phellopilus nigrolimitatus]|nr:hypothetical protein DFH11DRAFT_1568326 [Phellopilus nigrolimitatus]